MNDHSLGLDLNERPMGTGKPWPANRDDVYTITYFGHASTPEFHVKDRKPSSYQ